VEVAAEQKLVEENTHPLAISAAAYTDYTIDPSATIGDLIVCTKEILDRAL
jgi:hypothetical protein